MEEILKLLQNKSDLDNLDKGLTLLSSLSSDSLQNESGITLVSLLNQLSTDEELTAKLRRKMKRILQFIVPSEIKNITKENEISKNVNEELLEQNPSSALDLARESINLLEKSDSLEKIEESIAKLPVTEFILKDSCISHLIQSLENFLDRPEFQINAKLRRRVKRLGESLSNLKSTEIVTAHEDEEVVLHVVEKVSLPKTQSLLTSAKTFREVEYALNSMQLPDLKTINATEKEIISKIRERLEGIFSSDDQQLTNKKLRHRIKKIIYILSDGKSVVKKPELKVSNTPVTAKSNTLQSKSPTVSTRQPTPTPTQISHPLLVSLKRVKTSDELNDLLTGIPTRSVELLDYFSGNNEIVKVVHQTLTNKIELSTSETPVTTTDGYHKITLTAKIRRKVTRFLEALQEILTPTPETTQPNETLASIETQSEKNAPEISPPQTNEQTNEDGSDEEIKITIKETKKRKRIEPTTSEIPQPPESIPSESKPIITPQPKPTMTYDEVILQLRAATSSKEIEKLLKKISSNWEQTLGVGCCRTRRGLKRAIESLLSASESESSSDQRPSVKLSPQAQQLIQESLATIETITSSAIQLHISSIGTKPTPPPAESSTAPAPAPLQKKKKSEDVPVRVQKEVEQKGKNEESGDDEKDDDDDDDESKNGQISQHKHILFIGQLSFDTTSADLLEYLKTSGVTGEISVRLLTDKETGKSKGAAFIDLFGGKRSLKRIIDLHHTVLKGRRINVEHTSKHGSNISETEDHSLKLKQGRMQQKILESEKIDEIMMKYSYLRLGEKRGIISDDNIMNRLYAMNVNEVTQIFEEYIHDNGKDNSRNFHLFCDILTKHDHGGNAVDQTKDRNRKRRYDDNEWKNNEDDQRYKKTNSFGQFRAENNSQSHSSSWSPGAKLIRGGGGRGIGGRGGGVMDLFGRGRGRGGR